MTLEPGSISTATPMEELLAHAGFLQHLARELVGEGAADLVQETYRVALEHPPRRGGPLGGWLATVATNLARNLRRAEHRRSAREELAARPERLEPDELALERLEIQRHLVELVLALPAEQRTVLHLRYSEGRTPSEIAALLAVPVKTIKTRHTRALAALRVRLDARSNGDRAAWISALLPLSLARPPAGAPAGILGGLATKKIAAAAIVVLAAWFAWRGLQQGWLGERFAAGRRTHVAVAPLVAQPAASAPMLAPDVLAERQALAPVPSATTGALRLRFRRVDGTPAAERAFAVDCANDPAPRLEAFRARTDAAGTALVGGLFAGPVRIWLDENLFDTEVEAGATRVLEFTLSQCFDVVGTVVDADGTPVAGASIWSGRSRGWMPGGELRTASAGDGTFSLEDVDAFEPVGARARGHQASECLKPMDVAGGPDGERIMRLVLGPRGGGVRGRVLDPDGRPLAGASVLVGKDGGWTTEGPGVTPEPAFAETDAAGAFEFSSDLSPGTQPLDALARGFPVWSGKVEVVAGQTATVEIRLQPSARIEGRVLGVDGTPIAGVKVVAAEEDRGGWYHERFPFSQSETDGQGWFALDWVAPGTRELNAHDYWRPEIGRARGSVLCRAGETATCELLLELGLTIAGRVVDEDGAPLAGWTVASRPSFHQQWYPRQATSDAQGQFLLANLGDSAHDLGVRAPDYHDHPRAEARGVAVGTTDLVLVVADAHAAKGTVRGRALAPAGDTVENLTLTLWNEGGRGGPFLEQDAGTGVFELQVVAGRYRVNVKRGTEELLSTPLFEVEAGGLTDLGDLGLEAAGRVEIELTGVPAGSLERLRFALDREGANTVELEWEDGFLRSPEVMPGRWLVTCGESELVLRQAEVDVMAGTTTHAEVTVELALLISLSVSNPAEDEITVDARDAAGARLFQRRIQPRYQDGKGQLQVGLPEGRATITLRTHAGLTGQVEVHARRELVGAAPIEVGLR